MEGYKGWILGYSSWAEVLVSTKPFNFYLSAIFLIPMDNPFAIITSSTSSFVRFHIIPQKLPFSRLEIFLQVQEFLLFYLKNDYVVIHGIHSTLDDSIVGEDDICNRFNDGFDDDVFHNRNISIQQQKLFVAQLSSSTLPQYRHWGRVLCTLPPSMFPTNGTFLVSLENPMVNSLTKMLVSGYSLELKVVFHVISQYYLPFSVHVNLEIGSRLPTYFPDKSISVTNNSETNYTLAGIMIAHPNLYLTESIVVRDIRSALKVKICRYKEV
ncbi:hypothetical protein MKW94_023829 [Papaver nudicaule]|uniref:Uncharacterized protein n=1 Tax=Papaver nudicaule TaxID=74823 RepID=A0AA41VLR3_PAPNU|nr:hypothetical protein [Papaver nudicaule]